MRTLRAVALICAFVTAAAVVVAQTQLSSWPFFVEATTNGNPGVYQFTVPLPVMGQSRDDLGDLRLFDAENHEIPYAIQVRKEVNEQKEFDVQVFNKVTAGSSTEATIDLGENPSEHNEVQIETAGSDFRRRVSVEGSDSVGAWKTLRSDAVIFAFQSDGKSVESNSVTYPVSRYRYLRVRVSADELSDHQPPDITTLKALMVMHEKGKLTTWGLNVPSYQLLRNQGAYASSWIIDLGARVPCERLSLSIAEPSFYRPFLVETFDDPQHPQLLANGNLSRRASDQNQPQVIIFDHEEHVRLLRLQITDYSNPTLSIEAIEASAPERELVFELKRPQSVPLRLYFGNSKMREPHYDFEKELSSLKATPLQSSVGNTNKNPLYTPEPLPFTERVPWLIYLVLAASSVALGWILFSLARRTVVKEEEGVSDML
ncbi:MAG TPA: DUF3999 family protein [Pyrinomonadaceae bacterium]|jgi:hypothetical protein|nr:DUF3999 family protein [Pyrinomonadaceae bacterium]